MNHLGQFSFLTIYLIFEKSFSYLFYDFHINKLNRHYLGFSFSGIKLVFAMLCNCRKCK